MNSKRIRVIFSIFGALIFAVYFAILIYATLFTFNHYVYGKSANLVLFDSIRLMWRSGDYWLIFKNVIGNVLLFFPLGMLLPLVFRFFDSWRVMFVIGFGTSFVIEFLQYEYAHRIFDIDDILLNGMGALVGLILYKFFAFIFRVIERNLFKRKKKK
ncbi:VanZ family protein [Bacillus sp. NEB1478]|uniref:VanZ family protein n=1 Tax=Bacillus sp. NEB1478 TaxID=3073816 RepID=UPI0028732ADC|nr:VanZ family protein [Bacillus sp. NEB1478]WNB91627.1 VanZ family protein [Bacillus sp. NEB1478]